MSAEEPAARGGFEALRLEAIAREAGVNKAMIRYYFGDKAGLVGALVDDLLHGATEGLVANAEALPRGEERVHAYIQSTRELMEMPGFMDFFDVLPHALRDDGLRARIAALYDWYREMNTRCFDLPGNGIDRRQTAAVAALVVAAVDGLAIQAALAPGGFDVTEPLAALEAAVGYLLDGQS